MPFSEKIKEHVREYLFSVDGKSSERISDLIDKIVK